MNEADLVTNESLERTLAVRFELCEHKLMSAFHREMNLQTWRLIGAMTALVATFTAAIKL